jgi:glyoxylase-like metal-dependent hydrolase (beta-lactamase superfamily II)
VIRLLDGVFLWSRFNAEKRFNFNGHFLKTAEGTVIVDPPDFSEEDMAFVAASDLKPDALVITNRNHLRAREAVLARWKIPTVMHAAEQDEAGVKADKVVGHGERFLGLVCLHLPGKSPGELGLFWPERRALLLGDALIAPYGNVKTVPAEKQDDPARLRESIRTLSAYDYDVLLVGDGDPVLTAAKAKVAAFLAR